MIEIGARQEARAIAALNHSHICQIYDVGPDYLVMEFIEGKPLQGQTHGLKDKTVEHVFRFRDGKVTRFDIQDTA